LRKEKDGQDAKEESKVKVADSNVATYTQIICEAKDNVE